MCFRWERNDEAEGGGGIAYSLGWWGTEFLRPQKPSGGRECRRGRQCLKGEGVEKERHTFKGNVDKQNKDFVWGA